MGPACLQRDTMELERETRFELAPSAWEATGDGPNQRAMPGTSSRGVLRREMVTLRLHRAGCSAGVGSLSLAARPVMLSLPPWSARRRAARPSC